MPSGDNQWGETNHQWKGDNVTYAGAHARVRRKRGNAKEHTCRCGAPAREWANLTGNYPDPNDYEPMCVPCHRTMDDGPHACRRQRVL